MEAAKDESGKSFKADDSPSKPEVNACVKDGDGDGDDAKNAMAEVELFLEAEKSALSMKKR